MNKNDSFSSHQTCKGMQWSICMLIYLFTWVLISFLYHGNLCKFMASCPNVLQDTLDSQFLKWFCDQIFTSWFFRCITKNSLKEWKWKFVPEIFKFEKCVKYANEMTDDVIHSTQYYIIYINLGQFTCTVQMQTNKTW